MSKPNAEAAYYVALDAADDWVRRMEEYASRYFLRHGVNPKDMVRRSDVRRGRLYLTWWYRA